MIVAEIFASTNLIANQTNFKNKRTIEIRLERYESRAELKKFHLMFRSPALKNGFLGIETADFVVTNATFQR